jgi:hypothetical protein
MFQVTKNGPNRVDVAIDGSLDGIEMEAGLETLFDYAKGVTDGRMLYRISNFAMPTIGALGVEMRHLPHLFRLLATFDRCAVLSDTDWLKTMAQVEGKLLPGLEIKGFDMDEVDAAEAWLAETET